MWAQLERTKHELVHNISWYYLRITWPDACEVSVLGVMLCAANKPAESVVGRLQTLGGLVCTG